VYKACLGDKKRKNFLIHSTLLFHGKTKTKKVRMGIIHDETRRERKVVKSFVDIFSTAFFFRFGANMSKDDMPRFIARWANIL
jgi:hypothetical protein